MTRSAATVERRPVAPSRDLSLADAIARLETQLDDLRAQAADALIVAIVQVVGHRIFNAREVAAHAALDPHLREALDTAGVTCGRSIGHFLRRHDGRLVSGVRIVRLGDDRDGAVWTCEFDL
jgi:hypothetical protein